MDYWLILRIGMLVLVFVLLFVAFLLLMRNIAAREKAKQKMSDVYDRLVRDNEARIRALEQERLLFGEVQTSGFLDRVDKMLQYSRISFKFPWLTATHYIFLVASLSIISFIFTLLFFKNLVLSIVVAALIVIIPSIVLNLMRRTNYKHTERQFLQFINMVSTGSKSSNDILTLLESACFYVGDPIQTTVARAVIRARGIGDYGSCLRTLSAELEYPLFGRFLRDLELCSRDDSDFNKIVDEFRPIAESTIANEAKIEALYTNGRMSALLLICLSLVIVLASGLLLEMKISDIVALFTDSFVGRVISIILAVLYILVFRVTFVRSRR